MVNDNQTITSASRSERQADNNHQFDSRSRTSQQHKQLRKRALKIVNYYTLLSSGLGLIPTPLLYQIAVGGLLSKMLYDLSELYGTSLTKQKNKAIIASILGGGHSEWITVYTERQYPENLARYSRNRQYNCPSGRCSRYYLRYW